MSPAIFDDTTGIINSHDLISIIRTPIFNNNQKLPYDNAAMPVKQIDAFKGRPEIIHTGRVTVQIRSACWILWFEHSGME
jgi:hypothetical protein